MHCKLIITGLLKHATLQHLSLIRTLVILWTGYHNYKKKRDERYYAKIPYILPYHPPSPPQKKPHNYSIYREWFQNNFHYIFLMYHPSIFINFFEYLSQRISAYFPFLWLLKCKVVFVKKTFTEKNNRK